MKFNRARYIQKFSLLLVLIGAAGLLSAKEYPMPMIVTPNPVFGLQWDEKDSSFLYLESKKVIVRDTDRFNIVKTISSPGENFVSGEFTTSVATGKNRIVSRTEDGSMYFWEHPYDESNVVSGYNYAGKIMGSAFSKNGNYIAFGDVYGDIHFLRQHQILKNEFSEKVVKGVNSPIYTLSFSEDCRFLVTGTQSGMAYVWNANTYKMVTAFNFYSRKNQRIIFDGDKIVFPVDKNTIGIRDFINSTGGTVDAKNLTTIKVSADILDFDLDKAGNYMVVVNANNGMDYIDVKNKTYIGSLPPLKSGNITSIKLDSTGKRALIGDHKGEIFLINLDEFVEKDPVKAPTIRSGTMDPPAAKNEGPKVPEPEKKAEPPAEEPAEEPAPEADRWYKIVEGHSIDIRANYLLQMDPYNHGFEIDGGYMYTGLFKLPQLYAGARSAFQFAWPGPSYPYTYTSGTATLQNPYLVGITMNFPVGIFIDPFKNPDFYLKEEIDLGFSYHTLWNGHLGSNTIITDGGLSWDFGDTFTLGWKNFQFNVCISYNTALGIMFKTGLGMNIRLMKRVK